MNDLNDVIVLIGMLNKKGIFLLSLFCTIIVVCFLIAVFYLFKMLKIRTHKYLLYLQQDEYAPSRFWKWYKKNKAFDKKVAIITILFIIYEITLKLRYYSKYAHLGDVFYYYVVRVISFCAFVFIAWKVIRKELDPATSKNAKIPLNLTFRARRIRGISLLLTVMLFFLITLYPSFDSHYYPLVIALCFQFIPFSLMLSVVILSPHEKKTREKFLNEAKEKFSKVSPYVIAVVGSYGKSTVKNMLGEILQAAKGGTFWPKAGINTIMGITRKIREELKDTDKYAVIEMGTYRKGSISSICELTPPNAAILTAINHMHLERFKTRENIYEAKTEVIKALPKDGILVCNGDDDFVLRAYNKADIKNKFLYGLERKDGIKDGIKLDAYLTDIKYSNNGTTAKIYWKENEYNVRTKIVGSGGLSSLLACFTMACAMGLEPKTVVDIIASIEPLSNRLVLKNYGNNLIYLEDGYNSNPLGFDAALDVLKALDVKRRIVMTPGIIELGKTQFEENYKIALKITKICDKVIFVGNENKEAYKKAFDEQNFKNVQYVESREEGFKELTSYQEAGDGVLIENDLPDWYEAKVDF
ncbi:MAG: Mur ligase family protein [Bdellovibrionota bacterium]